MTDQRTWIQHQQALLQDRRTDLSDFSFLAPSYACREISYTHKNIKSMSDVIALQYWVLMIQSDTTLHIISVECGCVLWSFRVLQKKQTHTLKKH